MRERLRTVVLGAVARLAHARTEPLEDELRCSLRDATASVRAMTERADALTLLMADLVRQGRESQLSDASQPRTEGAP